MNFLINTLLKSATCKTIDHVLFKKIVKEKGLPTSRGHYCAKCNEETRQTLELKRIDNIAVKCAMRHPTKESVMAAVFLKLLSSSHPMLTPMFVTYYRCNHCNSIEAISEIDQTMLDYLQQTK